MNRRLLAVLGAGCLALVGLWVASNFDKHEYRSEVGFQGEARSNPLLAAGFMLRSMGVPADSIEAVEWVRGPPAQGAFLLAGRRGTITETRARALLDWVEQGGYLIVATRPAGWRDDPSVSDPLLDALGIEILWGRDWWDEHKGEEDFPWDSEVTLVMDGHPLRAEVSARVRFFSERNYRVLGGDEIGACGLVGRYGDGHIAALCDPSPFTNHLIGEHDHAELLFRLATLAGRPQNLWLVYDHAAMPPLPVWLWDNAPQVVAGVGLLLLFAFWMAYPRFGPVQMLAAPVRREVSEHLQAAGQLLWRQRQSERLLSGARKAVHRFGRRRIVSWKRKSAARQAAELAELVALPPTEVHLALAGTDQGSRRRLLAIIQALHAIRRRLERSRE